MGKSLVEKDKKLSESILWKWQKEAYQEYGPEAWRSKKVPFYLTSNPLIASQYAQIVSEYFREIKPRQKAYILDLGAGSGRFAFLFLNYFLKLISPDFQFCYVMTDISEKNLTFWREHPQLQPFFESGILDSAYFNADDPHPLFLNHHQRVIEDKNPLAVIAGYFFDTIPQEIFRWHNGILEEGLVDIYVKEGLDGDYSQINEIEWQINYRETAVPIEEFNTYNSFSNPFLYPSGAIKVIHFLKEMSDTLLILSCDQGVGSTKQAEQFGAPKLSLHGTFSIPVDYNLISQSVEKMGGKGYLARSGAPEFVAGIFLFSKSPLPQTLSLFNLHIGQFSSYEYWKLIEKLDHQISIDAIYLLLRLGKWDPVNFNYFYSEIEKHLGLLMEGSKELWREALAGVAANSYILNKEEGIIFSMIGVLLFKMEFFQEALHYFKKHLEIDQDDRQILHNIALCCQRLKRYSEAIEYYNRSKNKTEN